MKKKPTSESPQRQGIRLFTIDDRDRLRCPAAPTIAARLDSLTRTLSLIRAASIGLGSEDGKDLDAVQVKQTIESLAAQAREALEDVFWLTELDDNTLHVLAPDADQRRELEEADDAARELAGAR